MHMLDIELDAEQVSLLQDVARHRGVSIEEVVNQIIVEQLYRDGGISLNMASKFLGMSRYKTAKLFGITSALPDSQVD